MTSLLNAENYKKGMLIDSELMAGVSAAPEGSENAGKFLAFVLQHSTGEYLGARHFPTLEEALEAINRIPREWKWEATGGGCNAGACDTGNCPGVCSRASAAAGGGAAAIVDAASTSACGSARRSADT